MTGMIGPVAELRQRKAIALAVDNAATFYLAGHENTAKTISWTRYLLLSSRAADGSRQSARRAVRLHRASAGALTLLRMPSRKSLRLYPPAPRSTRSARSDEICGGACGRANRSICLAAARHDGCDIRCVARSFARPQKRAPAL